MTRLRPASGVAVIEEESAVYVAPLPDGPITVLEGVAALIWVEACAGERGTVSARVARSLLPPPAERIEQEIDRFVDDLVDHGFLEVAEG